MSRRNLLASLNRPSSANIGQRCFNKDVDHSEKFVYTFKPVFKSYHSTSDIIAGLRCPSQNKATGSYKPEPLFLRRRSSPAACKVDDGADVDSNTSSEDELRSLATLFDSEVHCLSSQEEQQGQGEMDPAMYEAVCAVFDDLDQDGSGSLSREELKYALRACGDDLTDEGLDELMAQHDVDGDGQFSKEEFVDCVCKMHSSIDPDQMAREREEAADCIMTMCDVDGTGCISFEELKNVLMNRGNPNEQMSEEECQEMFDDMNSDGSGNITREDLVAYLQDNQGNIFQSGQGQEESV